MAMTVRPLGIVKEALDAAGLEITYAYDDIVFVDHSLMIISFRDDDPGRIDIYFNRDCEPQTRRELSEKVRSEAEKRELIACEKGAFRLEDDPGTEQLKISFFDEDLVY